MDRSADLLSWEPIATGLVGTGDVMSFVDQAIPTPPGQGCFHRVRQP